MIDRNVADAIPTWRVVVLFGLVGAGLSLIAVTLWVLLASALAQTPHHPYHYIYEGWLTSEGGSCCSSNDCTGAEGWRYGRVGYEVRIGGQWVPVPPLAVRPYVSPDMNAHVCIWRGEIRCFIPGGGV